MKGQDIKNQRLNPPPAKGEECVNDVSFAQGQHIFLWDEIHFP